MSSVVGGELAEEISEILFFCSVSKISLYCSFGLLTKSLIFGTVSVFIKKLYK
jgi:hypothetical protein